MKQQRYFEVEVGGGNMILSEIEIEKYKTYIRKVNTELTEKELEKLPLIEPLTKSNVEFIKGNS